MRSLKSRLLNGVSTITFRLLVPKIWKAKYFGFGPQIGCHAGHLGVRVGAGIDIQFFHVSILRFRYNGGLWTSCRPPPKRCRKSGVLSFFHTFFAFSCHIGSNTCSDVMILYPNHNLMFLNTFLTLFWCQIIFTLSQRREITIYDKKSTKNRTFFNVFFAIFWWSILISWRWESVKMILTPK